MGMGAQPAFRINTVGSGRQVTHLFSGTGMAMAGPKSESTEAACGCSTIRETGMASVRTIGILCSGYPEISQWSVAGPCLSLILFDSGLVRTLMNVSGLTTTKAG